MLILVIAKAAKYLPKEITDIALTLKQTYPSTQFFTGHCTGANSIELLQQTLSSQLEASVS